MDLNSKKYVIIILMSVIAAVSTNALDINIDGKVIEGDWQSAQQIDTFYETYPGENIEPSVKTEAYILYDDKKLYMAFKCHDSKPDKIRAKLAGRDTFGADDCIEVYLDTFNDNRRAIYFLSNPLGVQTEGIYSKGGRHDSKWDTLWDSAGRITETGYEVEMAIPFKSLRFSNDIKQSWGIHILRYMPRESQYFITSNKKDRNNDCFLCQIDNFIEMENIKPGKNLEVIPTLVAHKSDSRPDILSPMESGDVEADPSLDVTWGITPNLTMNATLNPDFSQIESDSIQLSINERFSLYYPEKRPFFMEGADHFRSSFNVLHTRKIGDPHWGVKFTGKEGRYSMGALVAKDEYSDFIIPGLFGSTGIERDENSLNAVLRMKRDVGSKSYLGWMFTGREAGDYRNMTLGVDGSIGFSRSDSLSFQLMRTMTDYPEAEEGISYWEYDNGQWFNPTLDGDEADGHGLALHYEHDARNWHYYTGYFHKDRDYRADLGFENQVDVRELYSGIVRRIYGGDRFFDEMEFGLHAGHEWSYDDSSLKKKVSADFSISFPPSVNIFCNLKRKTMERYYDRVYRNLDTFYLGMHIKPNKKIFMDASIFTGDRIYYSTNIPGRSLNKSIGFNYIPNKHLSLNLSANHQKMWGDYGDIYKAELYTGEVEYYFSSRLFLKLISQYVDQEEYYESGDDILKYTADYMANQLVLTYRVNPFTKVYVGYSDSREGYDDISSRTTGRTYFLKASWAFRP